MNKRQLTEKYYNVLKEEDEWYNPLTWFKAIGDLVSSASSSVNNGTTKKPLRQINPERVEALAAGDKAANIRSLASPEFQKMGINQRTSTITRERALARNLAKAELAKAKASGDKAAIEKYTKAFKDLETGPMNLQPVEVRGSQSQRKPFNYINPNSAEGRIEAQIKAGTMPDIWERDSSGRIIPGQGIGNRPQPSTSTRPQPSTSTRPSQPSSAIRPQPSTNVDKPGEALDDLSAARAAHKEFTDALASEFQKAGGKALSPEADARLDALQKKSAELVKNLRKHTTNPDIIKKFDTIFPA